MTIATSTGMEKSISYKKMDLFIKVTQSSFNFKIIK